MIEPLPLHTMPQEFADVVGRLLVATLTDWEVGLGDGCQRDAQGNPIRDTSGKIATVPYERSQTDLVGENTCWKSCDAGYPTFTGGAIVAQATFADDEANFELLERGLRAKDPKTGKTVLILRVPGDRGRKRGGGWRATIEYVL